MFVFPQAEWTGAGRPEPSYFQIPFLVNATIPPDTEAYLKTLGLIEEAGAKGHKFPETLGVEFYFPIFSPRGLFSRMVSHLGQVGGGGRVQVCVCERERVRERERLK